MSLFIFLPSFLFFCFIDSYLLILFLNSGVTLSPNLSDVSPLTQTLEMSLLYGILIVTNTLFPNLSYVSLLTQTLKMLSYEILIVTDRLQSPHLLTSLSLFFFLIINFQFFSLYKLIGMTFNGIVS